MKASTTRRETPNVCPLPLCGLKGHKTSRSKKCKYNKEHPNYVGDDAVADLSNKPPATATNNEAADTRVSTDDNAARARRDAEECDVMDSQPLDDDSVSDGTFWSAEEYGGNASDSEDTTQHGII